jgi:hypothetical protein
VRRASGVVYFLTIQNLFKKLIASLTETMRNDKSVFGDFTRLVYGANQNEQPLNYRVIAS